MGSNEARLGHDHEINVLITGFGPFKTQYPINPSWEIATSLPPLIPLVAPSPGRGMASVHSTTTSSIASDSTAAPVPRPPLPQIRLLVHPEPVRVAYTAVRQLVPQLWDGKATPGEEDGGAVAGKSRRGRWMIDFGVHVGMAGEKVCYAVERRGHRDGYSMRDVDGVIMGKESGKEWVWDGCPKELCSDLDLDDVWRRWTGALPDLDLHVSEDAGRYLCDFIYYSSLAHLWKQEQDRRVVFLHVPAQSDPASISRGREVLIELVRAMVLSRGVERVMADRRKRHGREMRRED